MTTTRIKVPRLLLIERIQAEIDKRKAEYEAEMKEFNTKLAKVRSAFVEEVASLSSTLDAMNTAELDEYIAQSAGRDRYDRSTTLMLKVKLPQRPYDENTEGLERSKRILEASTDETISVSSHDSYYHYL